MKHRRRPSRQTPTLCGGRGTLRPPGLGTTRHRGSHTRVRWKLLLRAHAAIWPAAALDDTAGGVMRLTVGRENVPEAGRAPLVLAPSMLSRVGLTLTRLSDCAPFKSLGVTCDRIAMHRQSALHRVLRHGVKCARLVRWQSDLPVLQFCPRKEIVAHRLKFVIRALLKFTLRKKPGLVWNHGRNGSRKPSGHQPNRGPNPQPKPNPNPKPHPGPPNHPTSAGAYHGRYQ